MSEHLKSIQQLAGLTGSDVDGIMGPKTVAAIDALKSAGYRLGLASSFADPEDVASFRACKKAGHTDNYCFGFGDNGIGAWGDDCSEGTGLACAIPPDDMIELFGSVNAAHGKQVLIEAVGNLDEPRIATIKDRMPWRRNITNGAVIDCNPDLVAALGQSPPMMIEVRWRKA